MSALDDLFSILETTEVMKQALRNLKEESAHLLGDICREYQKTGQPVPDHHLNPAGYLAEAILKALTSAGLISRQEGSRLSLYCYEPAAEGLAQYERLKAEGFYKIT